MKISFKIGLAASIALGLISLPIATIYAQESPMSAPSTPPDGGSLYAPENKAEQSREDTQKKVQQADKPAEKTLEKSENPDNSLGQKHSNQSAMIEKVCKKRETSIKNIMSRQIDRGQKQFELFTAVSARTQTYVTINSLEVPNYAVLLVNVEKDKLAAQSAIEAAKASQSGFTCAVAVSDAPAPHSGSKPKAAANAFKASLRSQNKALKAYRKTVRDLTLAVRAAAPTKPDPSAISPATDKPGGQE